MCIMHVGPVSPLTRPTHQTAETDEGSDAEDELAAGVKGVGDGADASGGPQLPPLPDTALEQGILPRVIKTLVDRRAAVKKLLKVWGEGWVDGGEGCWRRGVESMPVGRLRRVVLC